MRNYGRVDVVDGKLSKSDWLMYSVIYIVMGLLALFDEEEFEGDFGYVLAVAFIGFGIVTLFAFVATTFRPRRLVVGEKGIVITELFSLPKKISWKDIESFSLHKDREKNEVVRVWSRGGSRKGNMAISKFKSITNKQLLDLLEYHHRRYRRNDN